MTAYWILLLITAFLAYLAGSLRSVVIASNFVFRRSLLRLGRGNVWFSNFRRLYGLRGFIELGLVELVKDLLPLLIGGWLLGIKDHALAGRAFAGFCLLLGALYPVFYGFKGGHGLAPLVLGALCVNTSLGSAGSLAGALALIAASALVVDDRTAMLLCILSGCLMIFKHLPALARLLTGREEKFSLEEDISYKFDEKF